MQRPGRAELGRELPAQPHGGRVPVGLALLPGCRPRGTEGAQPSRKLPTEPGQGAHWLVTRMASPPLSWASYALESQHNPQKEKVFQGDQWGILAEGTSRDQAGLDAET